ncbi:B3 domain-containing protein Os07g0563300-like [Malania oleifera]|uniref:B3 domain-containing protein Os07g0563300-like n=1 Tax=Malania oleifera TaxID=397392 RepID=UPI0025ADD78A|nr:B3 domain-containing protein Os07g0563300-like [Malania oleifera]
MTSSSSKACFNLDCKEAKSERPRKGWRLRTGEYAELCDRCGFAFEEGRFCETFHSNTSGWRCCISCRKRVHCGCIVSVHEFVLLDAGGVECITCARKNVFLMPNPVWPASLFLPAPSPERLKDLSVKSWSHTGGSGPFGPWRQASNLFKSSTQSELHPRVSYDVDVSTGLDRLTASEQLSASSASLDKVKKEDPSERLTNGSLKLSASEIFENGNAAINFVGQPNSCSNNPKISSFLKEDPSTPQFSLAVPPALPNGTNSQSRGSGTHSQKPTSSTPLARQYHGNSQNGVEAPSESQMRNGRPRGDARGRNQLLPRYWPRITHEELQQISGDSNSVITPLFEKMLSASDAGRIGRLVLPKKCAEAYFPPISQPEGLPLKVQDAKGHEWIFQFRFWPNNNSRMYVLEGVTPCIQSMQLQAGDTVTFSRLEPEGKLVMGFRKASSTPSSDQGNQIVETGNGVSTHGDANSADPASAWSKVDKSGYIAKEVVGVKSSLPRKRKNSTLGSKNKHLRVETGDVIELKVTWEEAQGLLRAPCNHAPRVVVIEGLEIEEFEDAPIVGRPTIFATDTVRDNNDIQWVQCEDCLKWRKIPADALLPSKWTCSQNSWDSERSMCSVDQELTAQQLEELLPIRNPATCKKIKTSKLDPETVEALDGLDTLANIAILGEGVGLPPSAQATTKHPRHRPGCSCIVCIQPPSGKGPKHKPTCTCNVCLTVKRRFRTLMLRREKKLSEKEAETARKKQQQELLLPEKVIDDDSLLCSNAENSSPDQKMVVILGSDDDPSRIKSSNSPFKGQIDLNIQPEREEESSPCSDSSSMMRLLQDATTERYFRQQGSVSSNSNKNSVGNQEHLGGNGAGGVKLGNGIILDSSTHNVDVDHIH